MSLRTPTAGALLALSLTLGAGASARAQAYPPGYGAYGWPGWGAGHTVAGSTAAGMGAFAAGAGQYNLNTAAARQVNVQTAEQYNDYMYERTKEHAADYYRRLAQESARNKQDYNQIHDRILNDPDTRDLQNGDTLNAIYMEITAPKQYARTLQAADMPIAGSMVKEIPFTYASEAMTYSLEQLTTPSNIPTIFSDPAFAETRKGLRAVADRLRKGAAAGKAPDPADLQELRGGLDQARAILGSTRVQGTADAKADGEKYLKALYGLTKMIESPAYDVFLAGVEKIPTVPLRDVLSFMHAFNLRFGPAKSPEQREIYAQLYGTLSDLRPGGGAEQVAAATPPPAARPAPGPDPRITNFFANMDYSTFKPPATQPPPPPGPGR
jgi:hypothetical protein